MLKNIYRNTNISNSPGKTYYARCLIKITKYAKEEEDGTRDDEKNQSKST